ncbi:hypothetical protein VB774_15505 [Pseudanabaena galeata UHCC 0370]|uniref:Uncharacterized protein n=1 Tax=Pseudanabaena galeata UHCC 0370 TaxID=3110310 RepID=A0ABU5TLW9_9CYAN|nr:MULTISPECIES: hypothetical protein [Pseudanabaena]MEA5479031.1 hypothetical protein [Pseudanabaena galeata UHCC 0370]MEA5485899.1 hypothetical protein [Pseudanabaena sp. CCNP1317]WGS71318.1 hypothetical protein OA858_16600 [Pseudanabaena galeata CCNP1313]
MESLQKSKKPYPERVSASFSAKGTMGTMPILSSQKRHIKQQTNAGTPNHEIP